MFNTIKFRTLDLRRMSVLGGLVFAALIALLPISAGAQCATWDARGRVTIMQRGLNYSISLILKQKGRVVTGYAYNGDPPLFATASNANGEVDGTIDGDSFSVQIYWPGNLIGVYNAKVRASGKLDGETYDKNNTNIRQTWRSLGVLKKCAPAGPSKPIEIGSLFKLPPSSPSPPVQNTPVSKPSPPPPPMKVPGIIASRVIFPVRGQSWGFVVLTWDGGSDHPYAEIWFKVNGGEETFVVEQGKGERQVTVERGRSYEYILTDAGKTLSTVSFFVPLF